MMIAIEGPNGCGKSTVVEALVKSVEAKLDVIGSPSVVHRHKFPSAHGEVGRLIRRRFQNEISIEPVAMLPLMVADALDVTSREIDAVYRNGDVVICDRSPFASGFVYQTAVDDVALLDVLNVTSLLRSFEAWRDIQTFILQWEVDTLISRLQAREAPHSAQYERWTKEHLDNLSNRYDAYETMDGKAFTIECDGKTVDQIVMEICELVYVA